MTVTPAGLARADQIIAAETEQADRRDRPPSDQVRVRVRVRAWAARVYAERIEGDVATLIEVAVILGQALAAPGVPENHDTRSLRDQIAARVAAMHAAGITPDVVS